MGITESRILSVQKYDGIEQEPSSHSGQRVRGPRVVEEPFERVDSDSDLEAGDIVIAVIGLIGSGKSTFIRSVGGLDTNEVGHSLKPFTQEVTAIKVWDQASGRHVVLMDTPGFDDTYKSDLNIFNMVSNWLVSSYDDKKRLSGVLYLHRITDNRVAETPLKNSRVLRQLCGKDTMEKVYLTTTMWDEVELSVGEKRLDKLEEEHWKTMIDQGAQILGRCRYDDDSARKLIQTILSKMAQTNDVAQEGTPLLHPSLVVDCSLPLDTVQQPKVEREHPQTVQELEVAEGILDIKDPEADDILIAVLGPTGSGKSAFIRSASGVDTNGVSHSLRSFTQEVIAINFRDQVSGRRVVLVDTPGFDNTSKSDIDVLAMIAEWLVLSHNNKELLSGILYLHRITDNHMSSRSMKVFRELCGKDAMDIVYLTTTMWDEVELSAGEKTLDELRKKYWESMIDQGAQIACCRHDDDSAKMLIRQIIDKELALTDGKDSHGKVLLIQKEMVQLKKELKETAAGRQLYSQLEVLIEKRAEVLQRIDKERKKATPDARILKHLKKENTELRVQIADNLRQMQQLKLSWFKRFFSKLGL